MAKGKGGLGRGLESLFEDAAPSLESDAKIETLPLREIEPDPDQPRKTFDEEALGELAASIAEHGLLQPIAVRPQGLGGYSIVAGERRWRACRMAGLTEVPVVVKDVSDEQAMELALVENLQREDLDPVEEAAGIRELMTRCDLTQEQAARKLGKSRSALANSLRLLNLPETVLELLKGGFLTTGHAKVVLGLPTPELQEHQGGRLGDGPMVGHNPILSREVSEQMAQVGREQNIQHQVKVYAGYRTGTDADGIILAGAGARGACTCVPLRYMHTPVEVISVADVENTARLAAAYVAQMVRPEGGR